MIIAASHEEFGLAHGNYEEFRFFTGLRQSEQIALTIHDCDLTAGKISINKAVVYRREKNRTKTGVDREITLCGRALDVLKRQLLLREELRRAGKIDHDLVFFDADGAPIINLSYPYRRCDPCFQLPTSSFYRCWFPDEEAGGHRSAGRNLSRSVALVLGGTSRSNDGWDR